MKNRLVIIFSFAFLSAFAQNAKLYVRPGNSLATPTGFSGIGINKPQAIHPLHMYDAGNNSTTLKIDLEQTQQSIPGGGFQNVQPAFAIRVNTQYWGISPSSDVFSVDFNGKVKTGTGFGTEQLAVGQTFAIYRNSTNHTKITYFGDQPQFEWTSSGNNMFRFIHGNTSTRLISLSPGGKVGIKTEDFQGDHDFYVNGSVYVKGDSPEVHSMYIEGSAIAEEIFVKLKLNWPDYVFAADYALMPLDEVAAFIEAEGHLPGMPSADQVAQQGIATGETIRLLTEKVEELMLYAIALQKEMDEMKRKMIFGK